jgi:hypothetical protein
MLSEQEGRGSLVLGEWVVAGVIVTRITEVIADMTVVEEEEELRVCSTLLRQVWYMFRDRNKVRTQNVPGEIDGAA